MLYTALFAAFGVASPFLPGLMQEHGLSAGQLGVVLAAGTAVRLLAGPAGGRLADASGRSPLVLAAGLAAAAAIALGYGPARGLWPLLGLSVSHACLLAPLVPIADALSMGAALHGRFEYGWVRAAGSAAFIAGTLLSGTLVALQGLGVIVGWNAAFLAVAAGLACWVPNRPPAERLAGGGVRHLLAAPGFVEAMLVAALVGGSHAMHDGFEVIRWRASGLSPGQCSLLWASSVAAEVLVFLLLGPAVLRRLGPARAMMLAAVAGMVRWSAAAVTAWFPAMLLMEPLHGLTFALLHLACLEVIAKTVPPALAATAQALYGTVAMGAMSALVTLASGPLYGAVGAAAFWPMAGMCLLAIPLAGRVGALLQRRLPAEV